MKKSHMLLAVVTAVVLLALVVPKTGEHKPAELRNLPWQIDMLPDGGSRVFGLTLGHSTIADARRRHGVDMEVAVVAARNEPGKLEGYYPYFSAGGLNGKMVLATDLSADVVTAMRDRALKAQYMDGSTRKYRLERADFETALQARIIGITFLPAVGFDADTAIGRFGPPQERIRIDKQAEHLLYPALGLDILVHDKGKEILQYVAPRDFARLRNPLLGRPATAISPQS